MVFISLKGSFLLRSAVFVSPYKHLSASRIGANDPAVLLPQTPENDRLKS